MRWHKRVAAHDGAVSRVAAALGDGWATIMRIITRCGHSITEEPARLDAPTAIGVDETAFLRATGRDHTKYVPSIADLIAAWPAWLQAPRREVTAGGIVAQDPMRRYRLTNACAAPLLSPSLAPALCPRSLA